MSSFQNGNRDAGRALRPWQPTAAGLPAHPMPAPVVPAYRPAAPPPPPQQAEGPLHSLWRHKWLLLSLTVLSTAGSLVYGVLEPKSYRAATSIELQNLNEHFLNAREFDPTATNYGSDTYMQTQIKVLQSETLIQRVLDHLHAEGKTIKEPLPLRERVRGLFSQDVEPAREAPPYIALKIAKTRLKVRGSGLTRIVEIEFEDNDPALAAGFANSLAREYMLQNTEARWETSKQTSAYLATQLDELKTKLEQAERRLRDYARANELIYTGERNNVAEDRLKQIQTEFSQAQADRMAKQSRYELLANAAQDYKPNPQLDPALQELQVKLAELTRQKAELEAALTKQHPRVLKVEAQIVALRNSIQEARQETLKRYRNEYEAALRRESLIQKTYSEQTRTLTDQNDKGIRYNILQREVESTRQLYESMLAKAKEATFSSALRASHMRVVDPAREPREPARPNILQIGIFGLFAGVMLGSVAALARDRFDQSLRSPTEAAARLDLPALGVIPSAPVRRFGMLGASNGTVNMELDGDQAKLPSVVLPTNSNPLIWSKTFSGRREAVTLLETFRNTMTSVMFAQQDGTQPRVLVITSPAPGEGKTTTVTNLGISWAEINRRVLLIDGDIRQASLSRLFSLDKEPGLAQVLEEEWAMDSRILDDMIRPTGNQRLSILPCGQMDDLRVSSLLHSPRLNQLIQRMAEQYDVVIIDTPPVLAVGDARMICRCADAVILVCRSGRTDWGEAIAARDQLVADRAPLLGVVLNDWNPNHSGHYGNYGKYAGKYARKK